MWEIGLSNLPPFLAQSNVRPRYSIRCLADDSNVTNKTIILMWDTIGVRLSPMEHGGRVTNPDRKDAIRPTGGMMIRDMTEDCAVLQSGYWRVQVDTARPHIVSIRADPEGRGAYCQELLEAGWGADSVMETDGKLQSSRDSCGHTVEAKGDGRLCLRNMRLGDVARLNWTPDDSAGFRRVAGRVRHGNGKTRSLVP